MKVFFKNIFFETFTKIENFLSISSWCNDQKLFCIFNPIFKLLLWQKQKSLTKSYYFRKSSICKKWLFMLTFIKILTNSYAISTWPQAPSGRSIYWPLTLTLKFWPWPTLWTKMSKQSIVHDCAVKKAKINPP